jgi:AcrR family transcriptional regulator
MASTYELGGRPYHHGDLRNACVAIALEILQESGKNGITLRTVAERIQVSHSAPYRHFRTKRDLLAACIASGFSMLEKAVTEAVEGAGEGPIDQLFAGSYAYAKFGASHPQLYKLMFGSDLADSDYPDVAKSAAAAFGVSIAFLKAAQEKGIVRKADPWLQAFTLWSALHGIVSLTIDSPPTRIVDLGALESNVRCVLDILLEGLAIRDAI